MTRKARTVLGALVIVGATAYLMVLGIRETSLYYLEIAEFLPQREALANTGLKVAGRVREGSISYDPKTLHLEFEMKDFKDTEGRGKSVPVQFVGIKPDMFDGGRDVIVEGVYRDGVFHADKVLTSCPSKYEAQPGEEAAASSERMGESSI